MSLTLAPVLKRILVSSEIPPGLSLTVATNLIVFGMNGKVDFQIVKDERESVRARTSERESEREMQHTP